MIKPKPSGELEQQQQQQQLLQQQKQRKLSVGSFYSKQSPADGVRRLPSFTEFFFSTTLLLVLVGEFKSWKKATGKSNNGNIKGWR